jgi:hypothetical protein
MFMMMMTSDSYEDKIGKSKAWSEICAFLPVGGHSAS